MTGVLALTLVLGDLRPVTAPTQRSVFASTKRGQLQGAPRGLTSSPISGKSLHLCCFSSLPGKVGFGP